MKTKNTVPAIPLANKMGDCMDYAFWPKANKFSFREISVKGERAFFVSEQSSDSTRSEFIIMHKEIEGLSRDELALLLITRRIEGAGDND